MERVLASGRDGVPAVLLLTGEPGLGKSHLLRSIPNTDGDLVLRGYSLEDDTPPYFPFRRAIARLERDRPGRIPASSSKILRAAGILAPDETGGDVPVPGDRLAVSDALTELCISLARNEPVVLVLDDMQWASAATWDAVTYVARASEGARLSIVLAARPEGVEPPGPGALAVAELNRNGLLDFQRLRPLSSDGITDLVRGSLGSGPSPGLLAVLASRTGGNPFFLAEVLRSLAESGQLVQRPDGLDLADPASSIPVPETLRLALWQRLARLPADTVETLEAAAVLGRVFDAGVVGRMRGEPAEHVVRRLHPAARAGMVAEDGSGQWAFAHDTLRDAVVEHSGVDRAELHRSAARAFGELEGATSRLEIAAAIAMHLRGAGDFARAITAGLNASSLALSSHAADEALELAAVSADLFFSGLAKPEHLGARDVHRAVALAAAAAADYTRAEAEWRAVLELTAEPAERARVLVSLATVARKAERSDAAAAYFKEALNLLEGGSDTRTLIEALVELSTLEGTTRTDYDPAVAHSERALELARGIGDVGLQARATLALANAMARRESPEAARPLLTLALERALEAEELSAAAEAAASLSNSYYWTGEPRQAVLYAERRLEIAERGRDAFALRHAHSWLAMLATTTGDWDLARMMIARAEPAIARMGSPEPLGFLRVVEGLLALRTGEIDLALDRTEEAMGILLPLGEATVSWYVSIRIWALVVANRLEDAAAECAAQEVRLATMPDGALPARSSRCGLGRAYVVLGDKQRAADCEAKLAPFAGDFHWRPARLTLAACAALRGDRAAALGLLHMVEELEVRNGLEFDLEETRLITRRLEEGAPAELAFAMTRETAVVRKPVPGGLSPRECEVLKLVAQGMSNRAIAERLVLSERTVVNHMSHIFTKIGVDNRAAATAFAFRTGLVAEA